MNAFFLNTRKDPRSQAYKFKEGSTGRFIAIHPPPLPLLKALPIAQGRYRVG